ncbi:MAG: ABC transporter permease [Thermoleophilia bacterium]|nr:ABC transporter permease [Thermoleophilia bacterium]
MARYIAKRVGLAVITLVLLSVIVFATAQLLPGNIASAILGREASQEALDALNHRLGTDRHPVIQYLDYMAGVVRGDFGESFALELSAWEVMQPALGNSLKLALLALVIVVPLSILGGVIAGLKVGTLIDRSLTNIGLSLTVMPEFVTGISLILVFVIWLRWLPVTAQWDDGAGFFLQLKHLVLPAVCLALVLFGYIARITRAGVIEALDADYTRTAYLKGIPGRQVLLRHVLRNALLPTIAVVATQIGWLLGGIVIIEFLFNFQGIGLMIFQASQQKDFPLLTSGVLFLGFVYLAVTLVADIAYGVLNPRIRLGGGE